MTRLIHLTDLHFGLHRAELVAPLREAILSCSADAIIVSGDLTHRATRRQFAEAMAFVQGFGLPFMVIPGNHDLPASNPFSRFLQPFAAFRAGATQDVAPVLQVGHLQLFGMNTADPFQWRGGYVRTNDLDRICEAASKSPADMLKILVCHHPLVEPPGFERGETRNAAMALDRIAAAGISVVLSGHLHHWSIGLGITGNSANRIFHMQTGTALCARPQEREHGFGLLQFAGDRVSVTPWVVDEPTLRFKAQRSSTFTSRANFWHQAGPDDMPLVNQQHR